jgi:micrococcal nuclease
MTSHSSFLWWPIAVLAVFVLPSCEADPVPGRERVVVVRVVDGDTVELEDGRLVRYIGVNTPEIDHGLAEDHDCFGAEARSHNTNLVLGQTVELEFDREPYDRYGRTLAYVWLPVGGSFRLLSEELLAKGYGRLMIIAPNDRYRERLEAAQTLARTNFAGLWGECP